MIDENLKLTVAIASVVGVLDKGGEITGNADNVCLKDKHGDAVGFDYYDAIGAMIENGVLTDTLEFDGARHMNYTKWVFV